jgi:hypothetical protein
MFPKITQLKRSGIKKKFYFYFFSNMLAILQVKKKVTRFFFCGKKMSSSSPSRAISEGQILHLSQARSEIQAATRVLLNHQYNSDRQSPRFVQDNFEKIRNLLHQQLIRTTPTTTTKNHHQRFSAVSPPTQSHSHHHEKNVETRPKIEEEKTKIQLPNSEIDAMRKIQRQLAEINGVGITNQLDNFPSSRLPNNSKRERSTKTRTGLELTKPTPNFASSGNDDELIAVTTEEELLFGLDDEEECEEEVPNKPKFDYQRRKSIPALTSSEIKILFQDSDYVYPKVLAMSAELIEQDRKQQQQQRRTNSNVPMPKRISLRKKKCVGNFMSKENEQRLRDSILPSYLFGTEEKTTTPTTTKERSDSPKVQKNHHLKNAIGKLKMIQGWNKLSDREEQEMNRRNSVDDERTESEDRNAPSSSPSRRGSSLLGFPENEQPKFEIPQNNPVAIEKPPQHQQHQQRSIEEEPLKNSRLRPLPFLNFNFKSNENFQQQQQQQKFVSPSFTSSSQEIEIPDRSSTAKASLLRPLPTLPSSLVHKIDTTVARQHPSLQTKNEVNCSGDDDEEKIEKEEFPTAKKSNKKQQQQQQKRVRFADNDDDEDEDEDD